MKRHTVYLLLCIAFSITSCRQMTDEKTAYLAHTLPVTHPVHQGMEVFAEDLAKQSKGKLKVKIFADGQLSTSLLYWKVKWANAYCKLVATTY